MTAIATGPPASSCLSAEVMRDSAAWMVGWLGGYMDTTRVAALQALAKSESRVAKSCGSGSGGRVWGVAMSRTMDYR